MKQKLVQIKSTNKIKRKTDKKYVTNIIISTFFVSSAISILSDVAFEIMDYFVAGVSIIAFIFIGILFDVIGVAVAGADEKPFHSMNSRNVYGAKSAISLIRNAEKVSNICNDVVGDIVGIVSGSAGAALGLKISTLVENDIIQGIIFVGVIGLISALTIGGKAIGKAIGINHSNTIIYTVARIITFLKFGRNN